MVSAAVSKLGCTDLIFVEPGVKVDGAYYRDVVLRQQMLPAIEQLTGDVYVFQQARATMEFLRCETPVFIPPDLWPANSPDLNPVDYCIWGRVQQCVYQKPVKDVDELKQHLVEVWSGLRQTVVDDAIDE